MPDVVSDLLRRAHERPDAVAFTDDFGSIGYRALARRAAGLAAKLAHGPEAVGILAPNGIDWVVADLAGKLADRTMVPLPSFFSPSQVSHVVQEAGLGTVLVTAKTRAKAAALGLPLIRIDEVGEAEPQPGARAEWRQLIYTSGTTGAPKGVRLSARQVNASVSGLAEATAAGPADRYLSVLPFALLLEQICAIYLPLRVGAPSHLAGEIAAACARAETASLLETVERIRPTAMVLVPQLLADWVAGLIRSGGRAPDSLRFVAVGGAHVPRSWTEAAWNLGIPAHEGYGLSECCSVVTVNRPGKRRAGTAGRPLPGVSVDIRDGEIIVSGPTVMDGYLGRPGPDGGWPTGDLGALDADGYLTVFGRRDHVIVTSFGRNFSPEWIEAMISADPRVGRCVVFGGGGPSASALVIPSAIGRRWFTDAGPEDVEALVAGLCSEAPPYARPGRVLVADETAFRAAGLFMSNGEPRRSEIARRFAAGLDHTFAAAS